ncbi:hypothetical protein ACFV4G_39605 [Kitasatospora sp. NPDC059747]|uniref:hypothetical protein n=1 Tax=Kitasatospora sp. NPDC059747 TaxID=3346930 RepID=UPI003648EECF
MMLANGAWNTAVNRPWWWVDLAILGILLLGQIISYWNQPGPSPDKTAAADALRGATTTGLTVVGILLPLSILAIQIRFGSSCAKLPSNALADFLLASLWLFISLTAGLYVLYTVAIRGPREDVVRRRDIGVLYGAQLFFLLVSCFRLLWAIPSVISTMI